MITRLGEAFQLLLSNFLLIAMVILTVWLPGNLLINYLVFFVFDPEDIGSVMRASMWIEAIFGPIYLGAMIYALWQIKQGQPVSYGEAIGVGLRNWVRLFAARFVAGLLIGLGFLVFIIPGVVLALRYALLDSVVIIEGADTSEARQRSTQMTEGMRLPILGLAVSFYVAFVFLTMMIYLPLGWAEEFTECSVPVAMASELAVDCGLDIVFAVLQITLFLCYWDKRQAELAAKQSVAPDTPFAEDGFMGAPPKWDDLEDADNPYRPPRT